MLIVEPCRKSIAFPHTGGRSPKIEGRRQKAGGRRQEAEGRRKEKVGTTHCSEWGRNRE